MYLHMLEKDEKLHFLAFVKRLAESNDQRIDARERYMINYMCAEMGLDPASREEVPFDLTALIKVFYRGEARRVLVLESMGVCCGAGSMHAAQRELLQRVASAFFLPEDFLANAESIIRRQLALMEEFDSLLEK